MAMEDGDWTITRSTGDIRYVGDDHGGTNPSYATVIQFHRWLQDFADDAEFTGDDELDIVDKNPSERSTDNIITLVNGFYLTAADTEHLFDGSIIQDGGDTIFDGIVNFGNVGVRIQVLQDAAILDDDFWNYNIGGTDDTSSSAAFMTDSTQSFTVNEFAGYVIKNTTDGSEALIISNGTDTIVGTLAGGLENDWDSGDAYLISQGLNSNAAGGISARWLVPTRLNGVDIDQRRLIGTNRTYERTYGEFKIAATARGNNVLALSDSDDLNNNTAAATTASWTTIVNVEGLRLLDISGGGGPEEYYSEWTRAAFTINQFYERMKWLSRDGTSSLLNKLNGETFRGNTHSFAYDNEVGEVPTTDDEISFGTDILYDAKTISNFAIGEAIHEDTATPVWKARILQIDLLTDTTGRLICDVETGTVLDPSSFTGQTFGAKADVNTTPTAVTTGGVFRVFAFDDDGTVGNIYGQLVKGRAPVNNDVLFYLAGGTNTMDVAGAVTERTVSTPFVGVSTGSALIGAYGLGMTPLDTGASDTFFDLGNVAVNPPNNVTLTVDGLVSGEDYVLVGTNDAGDFDFNHYTLNGALTGGAVVAVVVNGAIDAQETPTSGTIRITRANGLISRHDFTSFTGSTFTIGSTDFSTNNAANGANTFTSYVDVLATGTEETMTYVYDADRTVFIRIRDAGTGGDLEATKTFETTAVIGINGVLSTNIRTPDV